MYFSRRIFHTFYAHHMFRLFSLNARGGAVKQLGLQSLKLTFLFLYVFVCRVHAAIYLAASQRKKNNNKDIYSRARHLVFVADCVPSFDESELTSTTLYVQHIRFYVRLCILVPSFFCYTTYLGKNEALLAAPNQISCT